MRNPNVPESLEGWNILHRMFRFHRRRWAALDAANRTRIAAAAIEYLRPLHDDPESDDALGDAQIGFDKLALADYLEPCSSYVSILELGLYEATRKIHADLTTRGIKPFSPEWTEAFDEHLRSCADEPRNSARLWAKIPQRRYVCFYPMDKKRGEQTNWYALPYDQRAALMLEHGKIGRSYHGIVTQVISGSIGFDDWEWGVDLYADDPLVFKKLIYEMRFDEASAKYAAFGPFFTGMQFSVDALSAFLEGNERATLLTQTPA